MSSETETARAALDAHVREIVNWHFDPATGSPFWLDYAKKLGWDPRKEIGGFGDLSRFPAFEDEWLRGGPVQRWIPKGFAGKPVYVFETGGTTGIPKTRVAFEDFRTDYELFSATLPDEYFPEGRELADARALGSAPASSGGRASRAVSAAASRFCVDLDPRWVIKLIKKGWMDHLEAYKSHVIDQAVSILQAGHDIRCMFTTPKLLESLALRLESMGTTIRTGGHHGDLLRRHGVHAAVEPVCARRAARRRLHDADLRQHADGAGGERSNRAGEQLQDYLSRASAARRHRGRRLRRSRRSSSEYGQTGRVKLTTLTKEFFVPGFLERDEGEREPPHEKYPWDGVSGVRPFRGFAATTTVGVY